MESFRIGRMEIDGDISMTHKRNLRQFQFPDEPNMEAEDRKVYFSTCERVCMITIPDSDEFVIRIDNPQSGTI